MSVAPPDSFTFNVETVSALALLLLLGLTPIFLPQFIMHRLHKRGAIPVSLRLTLLTTAAMQIVTLVLLFPIGIKSVFSQFFISLYLLITFITALLFKKALKLSFKQSLVYVFGISLAVVFLMVLFNAGYIELRSVFMDKAYNNAY